MNIVQLGGFGAMAIKQMFNGYWIWAKPRMIGQ